MSKQPISASHLFVAVIAVLMAARPAAAAEDCLQAPNGAVPQGRHWYYHLDRHTQRKCWYLAPAGPKVVPPAATKTPAQAAGEPRTLAFDSAQTGVAPDLPSASGQPMPDQRPADGPPAAADAAADGAAVASPVPGPPAAIANFQPTPAVDPGADKPAEAAAASPGIGSIAAPADEDPARPAGASVAIIAAAMALGAVIGLTVFKLLAPRRDVLDHRDLPRFVAGDAPSGAPARFQAEWRPVGRPETAPDLRFGAHLDAKPVSTFAECAPRRDVWHGWVAAGGAPARPEAADRGADDRTADEPADPGIPLDDVEASLHRLIRRLRASA